MYRNSKCLVDFCSNNLKNPTTNTTQAEHMETLLRSAFSTTPFLRNTEIFFGKKLRAVQRHVVKIERIIRHYMMMGKTDSGTTLEGKETWDENSEKSGAHE